MTAVIALAAGGTGGHLFPAQALAEALKSRGIAIHLMTDERVRDYGREFPAAAIHEVPSATLSFSQPLRLLRQLARLAGGFIKSRQILGKNRPAAIVGFGGYPSLPPLLAAASLGIPIIIHEQNAVMGRANRLLARFASAIASSFPVITNHAGAVEFTGNPVRANVRRKARSPYVAPSADQFSLLVFGGSQGARFFADFLPLAIEALPEAARRGLAITQQCRPEDMERVRSAYEGLGVSHHLNSFFADMPERMAAAHLIVGRAGASTIAELGVIGRPAVLVPLPHSLENDQQRNAESFTALGGGWLMAQSELTATDFASFFTLLRQNPAKLVQAADAASRAGVPDAAEKVADLVLRTAR